MITRWNNLDRTEKKHYVYIVLCVAISVVAIFFLTYLVVNGMAEVNQQYEARAQAEALERRIDLNAVQGLMGYTFDHDEDKWHFQGIIKSVAVMGDSPYTRKYDITFTNGMIICNVAPKDFRVEELVGPVLPVGIDGEK